MTAAGPAPPHELWCGVEERGGNSPRSWTPRDQWLCPGSCWEAFYVETLKSSLSGVYRPCRRKRTLVGREELFHVPENQQINAHIDSCLWFTAANPAVLNSSPCWLLPTNSKTNQNLQGPSTRGKWTWGIVNDLPPPKNDVFTAGQTSKKWTGPKQSPIRLKNVWKSTHVGVTLRKLLHYGMATGPTVLQ